MNTAILAIKNITVRNLEQIIFKDLTFQISKGQHWALVGESGAGKSALLQTIAGKFNVSGGTIHHYYFDDFIALHPVVDAYFTHHKLIAMVSAKHSFRNLSNTTDFYYQQRFNSSDSEDSPTVEHYLSHIEPATNTKQVWTYEQTVDKLNLGPLLNKQLIKLSNGETKRLLIAAALLKHPIILLLDNPLTGLDVQSRAAFNSILNEITASGITVVIATSPNEIPDAVTHVAVLHEGEIIGSLDKSNFKPEMVKIAETKKIDTHELNSLLSLTQQTVFSNMVLMQNVTIKYGDKVILDKVNWDIKQGQHWALLGPNGAGKSTLLSLINGDNPQAYANNIVLFDRKRGTGESIWDIKSKIGFVSPELHQYFPTDNSCLQVIESGFYDTLGLFRPSNPQNAAIALRWMKLLELEVYVRKPLKNVSASTQRLVLLARALVKNPPLLIFDEPCQGLDAHQQQHFKHIVDAICQSGNTTLIYVTHYQHEIPDSVDRVLKLDKGLVV
ncbi:molybdate transport system ATP-binding protein [Mucilaginibacter gracilis]|uniref:Molybdate transport system ATP-binding protein n=1 Tax=Mucilaginibacter gracilis TaxID=423350 RepID=A0A495J2Y4_9SPHI|nr:ATP-binding cassette domain-containing protein [Mucilaginibacter gracilis]RKR82992.1 molybdate transport system ATP-binding protein [Mucilaginibacter gracilis]